MNGFSIGQDILPDKATERLPNREKYIKIFENSPDKKPSLKNVT